MKKNYRIFLLIATSILILVLIAFEYFVYFMADNSMRFVYDEIEEAGYSPKYWSVMVNEENNQKHVLFYLGHQPRWRYGYFKYPPQFLSHSVIYLVFQNGQLNEAQSLFSYNHFDLEGSAQLSNNKIENIKLKYVRNYDEIYYVEYNINQISLKDATNENVKDHLINRLEASEYLKDSPRY